MIARLWRWLFATHEHHWEIIRQVTTDYGRTWYDCRCKHCGKMKDYML